MNKTPDDIKWNAVSIRLDSPEECLIMARHYVESYKPLSISFTKDWARDDWYFNAVLEVG